MTTFGDQVKQYGGVPVGSNGYHGWWGNDLWFVDYDNGSEGNTGKTPTKAFKHLATALDKVGAGDTIYIKPRTCADKSGGNSSYILPEAGENWTVPYDVDSISLIGTSPCRGEAGAYHTYLRGSATAITDEAVLKVRAPFCNLENLSFHRGVATKAEVWFYHYGTTNDYGYGGSVYNCLFRLASGASSTAAHGLVIDGAFWTDVRHCYFDRCMSGITIYSGWQEPDDIHIVGCVFTGQAAERSADIWIYGGVDNIDIDSCRFPNTTPSGGLNYYIYVQTAGTGQVSNCYSGLNHATTGFSLNGLIITNSYGGETINTN